MNYIPIPQYPPFKLRSSLIDKDPVIWVHLLEAYIRLFQFLCTDEAQEELLHIKTQQQLHLFLRVYLAETARENSQVFSLGTINPEITANTALLRTYVFQLVKNCSFVKLNISGESVWNFIAIYVHKNAATVRGLVDGTFKSRHNDNKKLGNISLVEPVQKYVEQLIKTGRFTNTDLQNLSLLLGQSVASADRTKTFVVAGSMEKQKKDKIKQVSKNTSTFAETFVSPSWIELLESLYAGGESIHAKTIENIMVVSVLSLPKSKMANLVTALGVNSAASFVLAPLFCSVMLSDAYKEMNPGLEERLPFLRRVVFELKSANVDTLRDFFPELTETAAETVLREHDDDVEHVTHMLLERPELIEELNKKIEKKTENNHQNYKGTKDQDKGGQDSSRFKEELLELFTRKEVAVDTKKHTLSAALKLMYEDDEDEPDDTYDEQEKTVGEALDDSKARTGRFRVDVAEQDSLGNSSVAPVQKPEREHTETPVEAIERFLFGIYKTKGEDAFAKTSRKSSERQNMKKVSGWSDEQIEGWMKMLMKSPKRFRLLEEKYMFDRSTPRIPQPSEKKEKKEKGGKAERKEQSSGPQKTETPDKLKEKRTQAKNEQRKASKANHNRKAGHNKKTSSEMAGMRS